MLGQIRLVGDLHAHHRRVARAQRQLHIAPLGNPHGVVQRLSPGIARLGAELRLEQLAHLLGALDVQLGCVVKTVGIALDFAHRDADERVVGVVVFLSEKVRVVVAHQRQVQLVRQPDQVPVDRVLLRDVRLEFDEKAGPRALIGESPGVPPRRLDRLVPM